MSVAEPQKELRFTRAGQALPAALLGAACAVAAVLFVTFGLYRDETPAIPHPAWGLIRWRSCSSASPGTAPAMRTSC